MKFIKIKEPEKVRKKEHLLKKIVRTFFGIMIPRANPDFEKKIQFVAYWLIEFENEKSTPKREIGLGKRGDVILKMPYNNNYGYWVDNNLSYNDFLKSFDVENVTQEYFEQNWNTKISNMDEKD